MYRMAQTNILHLGLFPKHHKIVNILTNGSISTKKMSENHKLFHRIAENSPMWPTGRGSDKENNRTIWYWCHNSFSRPEGGVDKEKGQPHSNNEHFVQTLVCKDCGPNHFYRSRSFRTP